MTSPDFDPFKLMHGRTLEDIVNDIPTPEDYLRRTIKQLSSSYPVRILGRSADEEITITEEERSTNFHLIGAPGEGKSKFIEYNIQKDIDAGIGLCLLDPSEKGDTIQNVLAYCAHKGHEKVILIDPTQDKLAKIAPLNPKSVKRSVEGVMEALSILFEAKSTATPRIKRYLSALLRVLATRNLTLREAQYFANYSLNKHERAKILGNDRDSWTVKEVVNNAFDYKTFFSSSVNRMDSLWQEPLASMLGNRDGINFIQAVSEGWVILVNLSPYRLTQDESQLLGIIVMSQIIQAVDSLVNNNWKGVFYMYIDEAGRFATPQIDTLLSYKRKSGLRLVLAHHFNDQFDDKKVFNSIVNNARIKLMFDTPNPDDRLFAMRALGYGGDITPAMAAFANRDLPKRYAIIKKNKETPIRFRTADVKSYPPASKEYLDKILDKPFYRDARIPTKNPASPERGEASDGEATHQDPLPYREPRPQSSGLPTNDTKPPVIKNKEPFKF